MKWIFKLLFKIVVLITALPSLVLAANNNPNIEIINYSKIPTATLVKWTEVGGSKFSDWQADTLGVIWELGQLKSEGRTDVFPFNKHHLTLSSEEMKALISGIKTWIMKSECNEDPYRAEENKWGFKDIENWVKGGADVTTAPDPCYDRRMVLMGRTPQQDEKTVQQIWLHELYHAHSNYLTNYCVNSNDSERNREDIFNKHDSQRWFGEGTAEYFAFMVKAEMNGVKKPISAMLKDAHSKIQREGTDLFSNMAGNSAVALRLLMERGKIPNLEKDVLSAAVFHNCDWPDKWNRENSVEVNFALENWFRIENKGGIWGFSDAALR